MHRGFTYRLLPIAYCLLLSSPAFALDANPVAPSQNEPLLIAAAYEQNAELEDVAPQEIDYEGQAAVSEESWAIVQGLNDLTAEAPDEDAEEITYDVPVVVNDKVEIFIKYFQTRGRKYFEKWLARSERYLPMLKDIFRQNGLPEDLAYIALIESGFNPNAKSRARAVGMWQFMQWTGKKYGLKVDSWVDERRDPEKATRAAAKYLKDLYGMFNSWHLAAASYNAGEGRIMRAVKKHKTDDFWIVAKYKKTLKKETRDYIPKYIAAMLIAKEPAKYGFTDIEFEPQINYEKINIPGATDLRVIAKACECPIDEIKELNPQLLRWFTPPTDSEYEIKLPKEKAALFQANFALIPPQERLSFLVHKVKRGETLLLIAKRYGAPLDSVLYLNKLKSAKYVKVGTELVVPVKAKKVAAPDTVSSNPKG
ncbi:MAG: transglycosylase SLT domain-containing protein [Deltaproteobacteria bacterium]|nr:transglycosylase SLT domain-containing protein [Deltaproteobacteria bacterium]MBI5874637.1 transglycosylase SLT domain-containing protein [Deltaproteobacteria bacterium]